MRVFCGIDWSERHHDVALVDRDGQLVARRRISDDPAGFAVLLEMLGAAGDSVDEPVPVAIETPRGLLVAALRATGRPVYAINPMAAARYRDRHSVARRKSDHGDATTLANILRTDRPMHRQLPADSELAQAIAVLARAQQDAVWHRNRIANELRSLLREFYPTFLAAFVDRTDGLAAPMARRVLALAPTPAAAVALTADTVHEILVDVGRRRNVAADAQAITAALHTPQLRQPSLVEQAFGRQAAGLLGMLNAACAAVADLTAATSQAFTEHPDYQVITSLPGLADVSGARVLAEIGDDRQRFADARALKAYAGSAPITRASGRTRVVVCRRVKNQRLASTGHTWAFSALIASPGARAHYDRRRAAGDRFAAAQRNLFNRLLGILFHCLSNGVIYDEQRAFPPTPTGDPTPA
ncbi:IS110 family transposase [Micromonospora sp. NPDC047707]|uniref:IS110 family transposase n=1 Tax=Micromonospora sp. NPDC047707 TaxID=3154498 RepID=UPI00345390B4